jgi:hypothetical protein
MLQREREWRVTVASDALNGGPSSSLSAASVGEGRNGAGLLLQFFREAKRSERRGNSGGGEQEGARSLVKKVETAVHTMVRCTTKGRHVRGR